ncbi:MAG TPA: glycine/sarcosine/betaine reductase selenoprotein B family protein [Thermoanaerobaculia bacterium]|nr:glycine/sarcosine/betaine reductase selenoprotein B family protein [Thermoanaerobaculia bacterium]
MLTIARRCVPYTPFEKELSSATVTLVTATGVFAPGQDPFPTEDPGDVSYRVIARDTPIIDLRISHHHYDHSEADADPNIVFPLESLRELAAENFIGAVNDNHYSYGFTTRLRELYEQTFPEIADKVERSKTKLVLLTAGCPETCHRSIANLAREIESRGVPTLIISASPAATESVRPPRAMTWDGCAIGRIVGRANDRQHHKQVVKAALSMFTHDVPPGRVVQKVL